MGYTGELFYLSFSKPIESREYTFNTFAKYSYSKFISLRKFENIVVYFEGFEFIPNDKILALSELAKIYYETSTGYLVTINLLIILFCHFFVKIITVENNE